MKTDLQSLLAHVNIGRDSLTADRVKVGAQLDELLDQNAKPEHVSPVLRQAQLLGHTISALDGVAANLNGLLGHEVKEVARQKPKVQTPAPAAPAEPEAAESKK